MLLDQQSPREHRDDEMRIDLHLHSHASGMASNWWVKSLGLGVETRESYTQPADAYANAKRAGMDFVTLTDHETIDGAMTLCDRPDFVIGEEVAAIFPEDGTHVDVLVYGLTPTDHIQLQARRGNVYRLVEYLREARLVHVLAHPMFAPVGELDTVAVEKRLVLFGIWEFINGSRPVGQNHLGRDIALRTGAIELRQMAMRQGLGVPPHRRIIGVAGSDDHGGIYTGATFTTVPSVKSSNELLDAIRLGEVRPGGENGSVEKMAHTALTILRHAAKEGLDLAKNPQDAGSPSMPPMARFLEVQGGRAGQLAEYLPLLTMLDSDQIRDLIAGQYEQRLTDALPVSDGGFPLMTLLSSVGKLVDGHLWIAPYLALHSYFGAEDRKARVLRRAMFAHEPPPLKAGIFVDGCDQVHGVATMYRNLSSLAEEVRGAELTLVCTGAGPTGAHILRSVTSVPLPFYGGKPLGVPSLLDVLAHVAGERYDVLHVASPGPLGVMAMIAGAVLGIPVVGAYHTEFGSYAGALSGDPLVRDLVEGVVRGFYNRCAAIAAPSEVTVAALKDRGYRAERFDVLRNGVDTELFRPSRRDDVLHNSLGGGRTLLLYAGRISREKGLEQLARAYGSLRARRRDVHLVIAGDGPFRQQLEVMLGDTATFTGNLEGEVLARTFASCDVFVFPSLTDTLGRAVAEAQASGLPAVVFDAGGPRECIVPGVSGYVAEPGDDLAYTGYIDKLLDDADLQMRMGRAAREFSESLSWESVRDGLVALYRDVLRRSPVVVDRLPTVVPDLFDIHLLGIGAAASGVMMRRTEAVAE